MECSRCGADRILGQPCTECHLKPRFGEVNAFVVNRRTAVARVQESLDEAQVTDSKALELPTEEELGEYLHDFSEALGGLSFAPVSTDSVAKMVAVERLLQDMARRCADHPRLRPSIVQHKTIAHIIDLFSELWPTYSQALQAAAPDEAQRLANQGQKKIDAASSRLEDYHSLVESTRAYEDLSNPDLLERSLHALSISHPGLDLLGLDQLGAQRSEQLIGVSAQPGLGVQFLLLNAVSSVHFDPDRFQHLLRETSRLCEDEVQVTHVASQPDALDGLATSSRLMYEALEAFESALMRVKDDQAVMRRIIKFYGEFYEEVASPVFAWYNLIAGIKAQPYAKLIQKDATELARSLARQEQTAFLLEDDGAFLRHASHHGNSFTVEQELIVFRLRSYDEAKSRDEIINLIMSFMESVFAMSWSLTNALARLNIEVPMSEEDLSYMNMGPFQLTRRWFQSKAILVNAEERPRSWEFTLSMESDDILNLAVALAQNTPEDISEVSVRVPGAGTVLNVPSEAFDQYVAAKKTAEVSVDHLVALIELRAKCTTSGNPILTLEDLQYAAGCIGLLVLKKADFSLLPSLRKIHKLSIAHSARVVTNTAKRVFALTRTLDKAADPRLETTLNSWTNGPAPVLPTFEAVTVHKKNTIKSAASAS